MINLKEYFKREGESGNGTWERRWELLEELNKDNYLDCPVINWSFSGGIPVDSLRYKEQLDYLKKHSNINELDILEIGDGYGGLYLEIMKENFKPKSYTIIENNHLLRLMGEIIPNEYKKNLSLYDTKEIEIIKDKKFDILISNFCLNEANELFQNFVFKVILPNCKSFFGLIDDQDILCYKHLMSIYEVITIKNAFYHQRMGKYMICLCAIDNKFWKE